MKNSLEKFKGRFEQAEKNQQTRRQDNSKLSSLRNRKKRLK